MIEDKYYKILSITMPVNTKAFEHHERMMEYLNSLGITPNPIPKVEIGDNQFKFSQPTIKKEFLK